MLDVRYSARMALSKLGEGWRPRIERVFAELSASAPSASLARDLGRVLDLVVDWNEKVDLTAARDPDELVDLFVADAIVVARAGAPKGERWVDVGSGAGAPGIPLALLLPQVKLTLVEPKQKRVAFLRSVLGSVGRSDVKVERGRSEAMPAACCDVAVSRATLGPSEWLAEGARLAEHAVWVLLAKAERPMLHGFGVDRDEPYQWPLTGSARRAVRFVRGAG